MMEVTRIVTVQITSIKNIEDMSKMASKEDCSFVVGSIIADNFDVDDVKVLDVQDFVRDVEE